MITDGKLTQDNVLKIVRHALYDPSEAPSDGSNPPDAVCIDGIVSDFGFQPTRMEETRADVVAMMDQVSPLYFEPSGQSFLFLGFDKDGNVWTHTGEK